MRRDRVGQFRRGVFCRIYSPTARMAGYLFDERKRYGQRCWVLVDFAAGYDSQESNGDEHAESERFSAIDEVLQPLCVRLVAFLFFPMWIDENVDIGHQHYERNRSRSPCSRVASKSAGSW